MDSAEDLLAAHARKVALSQDGHGESQGRSHPETTTERDMVRRLLTKKKPEASDAGSMVPTADPTAGDSSSVARELLLAKIAFLRKKNGEP